MSSSKMVKKPKLTPKDNHTYPWAGIFPSPCVGIGPFEGQIFSIPDFPSILIK